MKSKNKIKPTGKDKAFNIINICTLVLLAIIIFYPLYFILIASISDPRAVNNGEVLFWPIRVSLDGYKQIFKDTQIWTGYFNTIIYTIAGTLFGTTITVLAGYALSRKDLVGRKVLMVIFMTTMYFGGGLIPTYLVINDLGLYNTRLIMILLGSFGTWNLIITRTFFETSIPNELWEAACIDGCGNWRFFTSIVLPISKAIIAVIALYIGVYHWNQYFNALIYISHAQLQPLQITLRNILVSNQMIATDMTDYASMAQQELLAEYIKYGVVVVSSLPILCIYPFVQKYFVQGVTIGALKG